MGLLFSKMFLFDKLIFGNKITDTHQNLMVKMISNNNLNTNIKSKTFPIGPAAEYAGIWRNLPLKILDETAIFLHW